MYYKLYIDSVFVLLAAGNLCLLTLTGKILSCTATHGRILAGAAAGAAVSCMAAAVPAGTLGMRFLLSAVLVSAGMLRFVFRIRRGRKLARASLVLAACGFFWGSMMIWILNRLRSVVNERLGLAILLAAGCVSYTVLGRLLSAVLRRRDNCLRYVEIYVPALGQKIRIRALVDTGNHLADPISGAPVSLVGGEAAAWMRSAFRPEKYHVIPYRSVGRDRGVLNAYELPEVVIERDGQDSRKENVIVAVCNTGIPEGSAYQMILNPRLLEE